MALLQLFPFLYKRIFAFTLTLLQAALFLYFKDNGGAFTSSEGVTIAEFMRLHGSAQFLFAAYAQKIVVLSFLSYPVLITILYAKNHRQLLPDSRMDSLRHQSGSLALNLLSFFVLLIFYLNLSNPAELLSNPLSLAAIFYAGTPLVWLIYLYSTLDLLFPLAYFRSIVQGNKLFILLVLVLIAISANPFSNPIYIHGPLEFWSNILLGPTVNLALNISNSIGFTTQVFSYPGAKYVDFGTVQFHAAITPECSGYEGISLVVLLLAVFFYFQRSTLKISHALIMIPIAVFAMFFLNVIRLIILIAIGHFYSPEVAFNGFHSVGGWLNLLLVLIISLWALNHCPFFLKSERPIDQSIRDDSLTPFLIPLATLITLSLLSKIFSPDFQWLYPIPVTVATFIIFYFRNIFKPILWRPSYLSVVVGAIVFVLWTLMIPADASQSLHFFEQLEAAPIWVSLVWLLFRIVGTSIVVPFAEELAFRGLLLPKLEGFLKGYLSQIPVLELSLKNINHVSVILSLTLTSLLFGVLHSDLLAGSIAGFFYGLVYLRKRNLMDAIMAHGVTNLLLAIDVIYFGNWSYW